MLPGPLTLTHPLAPTPHLSLTLPELEAEHGRLAGEVTRIAGLHSNNGGGYDRLYAACVAVGQNERAQGALRWAAR